MLEKVLSKLSNIKTFFINNRLLAFSILFFSVVLISSLTIILVMRPFSTKVVSEAVEESLDKGSSTASNNSGKELAENPVSYQEQEVSASEPVLKPHSEVLDPSQLFNVLVLGIDRRYETQESYRTDIMLLVTVNPKTNKMVLTSIPRDLWADTMKINGIYVTQGYEALRMKIKNITGQDMDRFIRIDFDALVWVIDAMGGVDVNVENSFTDTQYPNDRQGDPNEGITVTFEQGLMHMDGETALIFSRSRKGDNGEGSDFSRMRRQQVLLKSLPESFLEADPENIFNPFVSQSFYNVITQHVKTDLNVTDVGILYDLLKDRSKYTINHFVIDYDYLVNPPIEDYGQWVVIPKDNDYTPIHAEINSLLQ